jgi:hypothetical protein
MKILTIKLRTMKTISITEITINMMAALITEIMYVDNGTPRPLYPQGKSPWHSLVRTLSRPKSRSGQGGEGTRTLDHPARSPTLQH